MCMVVITQRRENLHNFWMSVRKHLLATIAGEQHKSSHLNV
jgi:hypothetical protein